MCQGRVQGTDTRVQLGGSGSGTGGLLLRALKERAVGAEERGWLSGRAGLALGTVRTLWKKGEPHYHTQSAGPTHPQPHPLVFSWGMTWSGRESTREARQGQGHVPAGPPCAGVQAVHCTCRSTGPPHLALPSPHFRDGETEAQRALPNTVRRAEQGVQGLYATLLTRKTWK